MINKGYKGKARKYDFGQTQDPTFRCPECKKILFQGRIDKIYTRCKHCGNWVEIEKIPLTLVRQAV